MAKQKYYNLKQILKYKALYNVIIGQRSNGKTFSVLRLVLDGFIDTGTPSAYIRRLDSEIKKSEVEHLLDPHREYIEKRTKGKYNDFVYKSKVFYLCKRDENGDILATSDPVLYCFALSLSTKSKGQDRGKIMYTIFDEFLTRDFYLTNEFVRYTEVLSSIMRDRDGTIHFLLGNTVNKYCPYIDEMGLINLPEQKQGTIDLYTYGDSELTVAVEYCAEATSTKGVQKYFAFDNPHLQMITKGVWEFANYPHITESIKHADVKYKLYLSFAHKTLCLDVVRNKDLYIRVTPQTHTIPDNHIVFTTEPTPNPYYITAPNKSDNRLIIIVWKLIQSGKVFYSDNTTGEVFNNWLKWLIKNTMWRA